MKLRDKAVHQPAPGRDAAEARDADERRLTGHARAGQLTSGLIAAAAVFGGLLLGATRFKTRCVQELHAWLPAHSTVIEYS